MKNSMRITSLVLAMLLVFSTFAGAISTSDFSDFPNDWSTEAMTFAVDNDLLKGYEDGTIAPSKEMTRAEMATVLNRAFKAWKQAAINFSDVNTSDWFYSEVSKAVAFETFKGTGDNKFTPNGNITRAQAFTAIARALKLDAADASALNVFADAAEIPNWATADLAAMTAAGYIQGSNGSLKPNAPLTRAEFAQVMFNIIKTFAKNNNVATLSGNVMVAENGLAFSNITIDGDLIVGANVTTLSLNGVKINGRLLVRDQYDLTLNINKSSVAKGLVVYSPDEVTTVYTDTVAALKANLKDYTTTIFPEKQSGNMGTNGGNGGSVTPSTKYYSVSAAACEHGSIAVSPALAAAGEVVTVTVTPDAGYELDKIYVNGNAIAGNTFEALPSNMIVSATFKPIDYAVNVVTPANGTLSVDKTVANIGDIITVTATPAAGFELVAVKVDGEKLTGNTFTMPAKDVTVTAEFAALPVNTYSITVGAVANGSVAVSKNSAEEGETITVIATPNFGYQLSEILVNGTAITGNTFTMPAENVTVTATFTEMAASSYSITIGAVTNGTLLADKTSATAGETVTITATPNTGYDLVAIKVNGKTIAKNGKFTMPAENVTVTAEFALAYYTVSSSASTNGSFILDKTVAAYGEAVTVTARPNAGYKLGAVLVDGLAITGNTFEMPASDVTVSVTFTAVDYTVTTVAPANGTVGVSKTTANIGDTIIVTATANAGYELSVIKVNGKAIVGNSFVMGAEDAEVTAEFFAKSFAINVAAPANGNLSVNKTSATVGTEVTVTATPDAGYELVAIKVNGTAITGNTFTMQAEEVTVTAEFAAIDYTITVETPANGTLVADKSVANIGETVTITATPADNYKLDFITVNGVAYYTNTFVMPAQNVTVGAVFSKLAPNTYSINIGTVANGTVIVNKYSAVAGEEITVTATPAAGYILNEIFVNGTAITGNTFEMPAATVMITATFTAIDYNISVVDPANGSLAADKATAIVGETVTVTATADTGYRLAAIYVNGTAITGNTFEMPAGDVEITAEFTAVAYTITVVTPANGMISADKSVAIMGETVTVTAIGNTGYELDKIFVNGAEITGNTFEMPAADAEITATFKAIDYTITVGAVSNGTVTADKATANFGDTITLTVTPNVGFELAVLKVNGRAIVGNTFEMPAGDVEITAEFTAIVYTVTTVNPANGSVAVDKTVAVMGETVTVTATANAGYELDEIFVNGAAISGNTFEMPAADAEVTATFKAIDYTITVVDPVNGTLTADKATATVGETVNFTAEPATGYRLVEILVDGSAITGTAYTMPAKNITVTAVFEAINYNITVIAPTNGTLSANKTVAVYGEEVAVTAAPAVGYKLVAVKVNGVAITDGKFTMPAEDVEITAEFELLPPNEYSITIDTIVNGSVSADKTSAIAGETVNLTVVADKHYKLVEVTVNGEALPEGATSFEMPEEHVLVSATFEEIPYAIRIDFPDTEYYFLLDTRYDNDDNVFELAEKILFNAYGGRKQQGGLIKRFYDLAIEKAQNKGIITGLAIPTYLIEDSRTFDVAPGEIITGMTPEMIQRCRDDMKAMTAQEKREYLVDMLPAKVPAKALDALEKALAKIPDADMDQLYNDGVDAIPDVSFSISDSYNPGDATFTIDLDWECDPIYFADVYYENVYLKNRALDKLAEYGLTPTPEEWVLYDLCNPSNFAKNMGDHHEILPVQDYYDLAHELLDAGEAAFRARYTDENREKYAEYLEKLDKALDKGVPKALAKAREKGLIVVDDKGNDITAEQIIAAAKAWINNPDITVNELIDIFGSDYVRVTGSAKGITLNIMISRIDTSEL